jgi:hypothetical protein
MISIGCSLQHPRATEPSLDNFIRRQGDRLMDGKREFRFVSVNIPNLHYVEDDMRFSQSMPFRLPDDYEIDDALGSVAQMGGQVVRIYALSVRRADDPADMPRYILGPGAFNEEAFVALDRVLAAARRHRVRVILPFVDQWSWWGGQAELAAFRDKVLKDCWTDPQLIDDYKQIIAFVVNRRNTITGLRYRDDTAILGWETGNELNAPADWTRQIAAAIKSLDPNHLVIDGATYSTIPQDRLDDPNVDFVQTHHYEKDPREMLARIKRNAAAARGHRPYHVGEFGFLGTDAHRSVLDAIIKQHLSGALLWSLRCRSREGGFYWHHEPYGGDLFKAYHWPGFPISDGYDERGMMRLLRAKAYEIRGLTPPPLPAPAPPHLLSVDAGGAISWHGSVGAHCYDVERTEDILGSWCLVGTGVCEAQVQYHPLFVDESAEPGKLYFYRLTARNEAGRSAPSNVIGPVRIEHRTLVDELWNDSRMFLKQGAVKFRQNDARKVKEDCHRISGEAGSAIVYQTEDAIDVVRLFVYAHPRPPASQPTSRADSQPVAPTENRDIIVSFSADCSQWHEVAPDINRTTTYGEKVYDFWKADLYTVQPKGKDCHYVKIAFASDAQLGRVEIEHDTVNR